MRQRGRWHAAGIRVIGSRDPGFFDILGRTLRSKCPVCGLGHLFTPYFRVHSMGEAFMPSRSCDHCGFRFCREPGYFFGVLAPTLPILALGMGAASAWFALLMVGADISVILAAGAMGLGLGFFAFFRSALAIYVAFDHAVDPPKQPSQASTQCDQLPTD